MNHYGGLPAGGHREVRRTGREYEYGRERQELRLTEARRWRDYRGEYRRHNR